MGLDIAKRKPKDIVFGEDLTILWKDGAESHYPLFGLRDACPCAMCVDEVTGKKVLDPKTIRPDIHILRAEYVGHYALRLFWSDGHNSGIYAFAYLRELAENPGLLSQGQPATFQ
jgi:ATP-binding protein involved in chromosome partitioning